MGADALFNGGITVIEVTLRTPAALAAIEQIASQVPEITVGVGTVLNTEQFTQAIEVGSEFVVSPGASEKLYVAAEQYQTAFVPGVITPSEIIFAIEHGYDFLKYFPATALYGESVLAAYAAVFPHVEFCPTGGISLLNLQQYLNLSNVYSVGGAWLTRKERLANKDWQAISTLVQESLALIA